MTTPVAKPVVTESNRLDMLNKALKGFNTHAPDTAKFAKTVGGYNVTWGSPDGPQSVFIGSDGTVEGKITVDGKSHALDLNLIIKPNDPLSKSAEAASLLWTRFGRARWSR